VTQPESRPVLRIVGGGAPSDEELAALVVAVATVTARGEAEARTVSGWAASGRSGSSWVRGGWVTTARRSALRTR
jgi:hypothetical protein